MKMKMAKRKSRDELILDTLNNSRWFAKECELVRQKYLKSNDKLYLANETKRIIRLLPNYWESSVRKYLEGGKLTKPTIEGAQVVFTMDKGKNESALYIRIFQKTSKKDVVDEKIWKKVEYFQKLLPEIWSPEIGNNLIILQVWEEVESRPKRPTNIAGEVQSILNNKYHALIGDIDVADIRKRVSTIRKQLQADKK
jgi:hypothetical protein